MSSVKRRIEEARFRARLAWHVLRGRPLMYRMRSHSPVQFSSNQRLGIWVNGAPGVINLRGVDGVTVKGNVQPLTSGKVVSTVDCTGVVTA